MCNIFGNVLFFSQTGWCPHCWQSMHAALAWRCVHVMRFIEGWWWCHIQNIHDLRSTHTVPDCMQCELNLDCLQDGWKIPALWVIPITHFTCSMYIIIVYSCYILIAPSLYKWYSYNWSFSRQRYTVCYITIWANSCIWPVYMLCSPIYS